MIVRELVKALLDYPQDAEVFLHFEDRRVLRHVVLVECEHGDELYRVIYLRSYL